MNKSATEILDKYTKNLAGERQARIWYEDALKAMEEYAQEVAKNLHKPLVMQRVQNIAAYFAKKTPMPSAWSNDILDYILNRSEHGA